MTKVINYTEGAGVARPATKSPDAWREDIKEAARRLFAERGFRSVSVEAIMVEVGAAKGTFYRFFPGKDELLGELVEDWLRDYASALQCALEDEGDTLAQKFATVTEVIARMAERTGGIEAFFADTADSLRLASDRMVGVLVPSLEAALRIARERGEVDIGIDEAGFTARFVVLGSLGALNAGEGTPSERIQKNMGHLPKVVARTFGMDLRKLAPNEEV